MANASGLVRSYPRRHSSGQSITSEGFETLHHDSVHESESYSESEPDQELESNRNSNLLGEEALQHQPLVAADEDLEPVDASLKLRAMDEFCFPSRAAFDRWQFSIAIQAHACAITSWPIISIRNPGMAFLVKDLLETTAGVLPTTCDEARITLDSHRFRINYCLIEEKGRPQPASREVTDTDGYRQYEWRDTPKMQS